ncbi:MAG TPA: beta-N-acetylglucosaminidase domain-containing protein [Candidatus Limnocylindria bacterium]|nr:beta-N-acetylglucosaminidase domain-containing protein [Candidatus Limnocylindria bacterium]
MGRRLSLVGATLLLTATMAHAARFMTGVVEGYYGRPWTHEARRDVIRFLGAKRLTTFVYGPKNDPFHRDEWRTPYPEAELSELAFTAREARRAKVRFVYALSPALDICYSCPDDTRALRRKLRQLARAGIRRFALFFDDAPLRLSHPDDVARFGGDGPDALARAQARIVRRTNAWLRRRGLPALVFMVPTDYFGTACSPYLTALDETLPRSTIVGWTGTGVIPATVTAEQARLRRDCLGGRRLLLWDNFPVNDTVLSSNLHLGPFTGRAADLGPALGGGHLLNPMTQAHASLVALGAAAAYFADPAGYDAEAAWRAALHALAPPGTLDVLAEQTRSSALDLTDAHALTAAVDAVAATYAGSHWSAAVAALDAEIGRQQSAADGIEAVLGGSTLGMEIAPWVDELRAHLAEARLARDLLRALKPSFHDLRLVDVDGARHVQGHVRPPNVVLADVLGPQVAAPRPAVDLPTLLACLGPFLTADIAFCPHLGLNVHGKRLYVVLDAGFTVVTGLNQHDRLLATAALAWFDWQGRQMGPPEPSLLVDGVAAPLDPDGRFDVPVAPAGPVTLVAATTAGDATAVTLP